MRGTARIEIVRIAGITSRTGVFRKADAIKGMETGRRTELIIIAGITIIMDSMKTEKIRIAEAVRAAEIIRMARIIKAAGIIRITRIVKAPEIIRITQIIKAEEIIRTAGITKAEEITRTAGITKAEEITRTAGIIKAAEIIKTAGIIKAAGIIRTAGITKAEETIRIAQILKAAEIIMAAGIIRAAERARTAEAIRAAEIIMTAGNDRVESGSGRIIADIRVENADMSIGIDMEIEAGRKDSQGIMTIKLKENERLDELQRNGYRIIQNPEKFCFGMDAVLLTGFAHAREQDKLLDLGTGTGIIPLLMEAKYHCSHLTGLEIQPDSADMNGLSEKIDIITGDVKEADLIFPSASFDCITCNPPYMIGQHGIVNPDAPKAIARHELSCTFEDIAAQTAKLLKPGGHFFLVHRPFRLAEIMTTLVRHKLEPKRMQLVYPYVDKEPNMVLLEAVRGGRSRMTVEKPLIVYREPGVYMPEIYEIYGY